MIIADTYYYRPEVSNSDLSWLEKYWMPQSYVIDLEAAYRFGSLLDAMITEPENVDYFKRKVGGTFFTKEEFDKANEMKKVFFKDPFCKSLAAQSQMQKVSVKHDFEIDYDGFLFKLPVRCKWDFYVPHVDMSGDLKSTACTTQKQFEESIRHFNYDKQAAWYMDIEGKSNFMFIGISKANFKIFKVPVKRESQIYKDGKRKYQDLAFRWWYLFGNIND